LELVRIIRGRIARDAYSVVELDVGVLDEGEEIGELSKMSRCYKGECE
jgi:hypothetical protein